MNLPFGTEAASFDDPLGLLVACHARIRRQLATLARLQRYLPEHGCDDVARAAATAILRYFDSAAPNHHADEEGIVFPRLRAIAPAAVSITDELRAEHVTLDARWRALRPLLAAIAAGQRANLSPRTVRELTALYNAHIEREEGKLIPLAKAALDPETLAQIGHEMAARRGGAKT